MVAENSTERPPGFKEYYLNLKTKIDERWLEEFGELKTDEERINFVSRIVPEYCRPVVEVVETEKDEKTAKELKESGNKAFGKGDFNEALKLYTESILTTPHNEGSSDLALAIANRSAVLYHLQEYQLAINDIDIALTLNYPKDLKYKALERKAKCFLALKKTDDALIEFKNTIRALDDCKLPTERKLKMQTDVQIMLNIITKPTTKAGKLNAFLASPDDKKTAEEYTPKLSSHRNKTYEAASEMVDIKEDPIAGRYATASEDIPAGDTILIEKAFCSVLLAEYSKTNCQHCFKRTLTPYPCINCKSVVYCSLECKKSAESSYHKHECRVLKTLHQSGVSITVLMAFRIIAQQNLDYFLRLKNKLSETRDEVDKYKTSDYVNIYHLVRHETRRKRDDFFERTVMALFLLRCLIKGNYFNNSNKGDENELTVEEKYIGGLLLRHLQLLQFNAHEISELEMKRGRNLEDSKSVFIGGGLYTTLALFNHSCDPGIVRYFDGTRVIVRTVKPIKKGEIIAENYGPIYSQTKKKERQEKLESQYWFKCNCVPCEELWPTYDEIDKKILRFRCDAQKENGERITDCRNVLSVPVDTPDFIIKCFLCGQLTNLFKGLKFLQTTDCMYQQATTDTNRENYQAALAIYLEILTMLHDILAPPFRDYLLCQQSIRKCMLTLGNKYTKPS